MIRYKTLKQHPKHFLRFTGLKVKEFDKLVSEIHSDYLNQRIKRLNKNNPNRIRKIDNKKNLFYQRSFPNKLNFI